MSRIGAIATGAAVAICLLVAGHISGVADHRLDAGVKTHAQAAYIEAADLAVTLNAVKDAVIRFVSR